MLQKYWQNHLLMENVITLKILQYILVTGDEGAGKTLFSKKLKTLFETQI